MNKFNKLLLVILSIAIFYSCSSNSEDWLCCGPDELTLEKIELLNVSYGANDSQVYDIYLPEDRSSLSTKVFLLVHGGGWISGDKSDMSVMVNQLKIQFPNYAIVNINYRLASALTNAFPMQINDIQEIISDLKSKREDYQISNKFGFIGTSAGAHLAMLYSYKYDLGQDVKFVCSIVGPTNFTDSNYINHPDYSNFIGSIELLTGVDFSTNLEYFESLSPYHVVTSSAPPSILFYGGLDNLVPTTQGIDMHFRLDELGIINEFTLYENEGHGWAGANAVDTNNKLKAFIQKHF